MEKVEGGSGILETLAAHQGSPDELPALLALVKERAANGKREEDRIALGQVRHRLHHLMAEAQRRIEEVLAEADRLPAMPMPAAPPPSEAPATLPDRRPSAAGAYLSSTAALRRGDGAAAAATPQTPDRYADAARAALDSRQAQIGEITQQIVEIQRGLSAL